jgi:hypothetical protein
MGVVLSEAQRALSLETMVRTLRRGITDSDTYWCDRLEESPPEVLETVLRLREGVVACLRAEGYADAPIEHRTAFAGALFRLIAASGQKL